MISHQDKCIFVHTPKCAGESIEILFTGTPMNISGHRHPEKHWSIRKISSMYPHEFHSYFKFSVVRNPWERVISWVKYRDKRFDRQWGTFAERLSHDLNSADFVQYMQNKSYRNMLFLNDELGVDYVVRMERLQEGIDAVLETLGRARTLLPHYNRTDHDHYSIYYNDESQNKVSSLFHDDISYFGYGFDDNPRKQVPTRDLSEER